MNFLYWTASKATSEILTKVTLSKMVSEQIENVAIYFSDTTMLQLLGQFYKLTDIAHRTPYL